MFRFGSGTGMLCAEGEPWRRHRRLINPAMDYRALQPNIPRLVRFAEDVSETLARVPKDEAVDIGKMVAPFVSAATGDLLAGGDPRIDPMVEAMARYPGKFHLLDFMVLLKWLAPLAGRHGGAAWKPPAMSRCCAN